MVFAQMPEVTDEMVTAGRSRHPALNLGPGIVDATKNGTPGNFHQH